MHQSLNEKIEINVVDREKYKNALYAIFYLLPLCKNNRPLVVMTILIFLLSAIGLLSFHPSKSLGGLGIVLCSLFIIFPFILSAIRYFTKLHISEKCYHLEFLNIVYHRGSVRDIIEIRKLVNWGGVYRFRTKGKTDISGFLFFSDEIPHILSHIEVNPNLFINDGGDKLYVI